MIKMSALLYSVLLQCLFPLSTVCSSCALSRPRTDLASMSKRLKVLIMGYVWPEVTSSAAGLRGWNLVEGFQSQGWEVIFSSQAKENKFKNDLDKEGVRTVRQPANDSTFDQWIADERPDFVVYDRFVTEEQFGWRVTEHSPSTVRILDTQDLHFLRKQRHLAIENGTASLFDVLKGNIDFKNDGTLRELASIYRCDMTLVISDFELQLLSNKFGVPKHLLHLARLSYGKMPKIRPLIERRKDFCMIGNFRHAPNYDATVWLKEIIWPLIRKSIPKAEVDIYGAYPPKEIMKLTNQSEGFNVKGPVQDHMKMFPKYKVNLAPLRFGAGIKGKISDGWFCGTPAATTPIGSEGMTDSFPFGGYVSEFSPSIGCNALNPGEDSYSAAVEFAHGAVSLYRNNDKWKSAQQRGIDIINNLYSIDLNTRALVSRLIHTKNNLEHQRASNWTGAILNYNLNRGTKYFSQWIEGKSIKKQ